MTSNIKDLTEKNLKFRDDRDWGQFHTPKNLAISLVLEATEVLEHLQWKTDEDFKEYLKTHREDFADELGDVFNYLVQLSHAAGVDLLDAAEKKIKKNAKKYPIKKAKGSAKKYNQY